MVDDVAGSGGNVGIPYFNLTEMGLEPIPADGSEKTLIVDCSAIYEALASGPVKFTYTADVGYEMPIDIVVCGTAIPGLGASFVHVMDNGGTLIALSAQINANRTKLSLYATALARPPVVD